MVKNQYPDDECDGERNHPILDTSEENDPSLDTHEENGPILDSSEKNGSSLDSSEKNELHGHGQSGSNICFNISSVVMYWWNDKLTSTILIFSRGN